MPPIRSSRITAPTQVDMYNRPDMPSKDAILAARDRILARHPKLRVVGCHLGSDEGHLERLAKRLDTYPNFAVDMAARVRYFIQGDHEKARQFLVKYQDRVLYATDYTLKPGDDGEAAKVLRQTQDQDWRFFTTDDTIQFRGKPYHGLALPENVARRSSTTTLCAGWRGSLRRRRAQTNCYAV